MKLLLYCEKAKPYLLDMAKDNEEFEKGIRFSLTSGKELTKKDKLNIDKVLDAVNSFLKYNISQGNCNWEIKQFILDLTTLLSADIVGNSSLNDIKNTLTQHIFHIIDIIKGL